MELELDDYTERIWESLPFYNAEELYSMLILSFWEFLSILEVLPFNGCSAHLETLEPFSSLGVLPGKGCDAGCIGMLRWLPLSGLLS